MKFFLSALCAILFISSTVYAQHVVFKEIKLRPNKKYDDTGDTSIIYPIVVTGNAAVSKLINAKIKADVLEAAEEKGSLRKDLLELVNDGLTSLSYEVTLNRNGILSFNVYHEACRGNCTSFTQYFNFDLRTGNSLGTADIFARDRLDSFKKIVFAEKVGFLKRYKEEERNSLASKQIDSASFAWAMDEVDSNCMNTVGVENFSLSKNTIEIIDPCEFPRALRGMGPDYALKYSYKAVREFLKPEFAARVLK
jgi:hypothetical protein